MGHLDYKVVVFLPKPEGVIARELLLHTQSKQEGSLRSKAAPKGLSTKVRGKQRADKWTPRLGQQPGAQTLSTTPRPPQVKSPQHPRAPPAVVPFYIRHLKG